MTTPNPVPPSTIRMSTLSRRASEGGVAGESRPDEMFVHELLDRQVARTPEAIAISLDGQELTYAEFIERVDELTEYLHTQGVGPGQRVAIYLDRGIGAIVAIFAALKSGAAYLPLDSSYPAERVDYILRDAKPSIVLTQRRVEGYLRNSDVRITTVESVEQWRVSRAGSRNQCKAAKLRPPLRPSDLAYVIYTSGSTGRPKGVMVSHGNLRSSNLARLQYYGNPGRFLLLSPLGFDSSVAGIFGTLTCGGTLVLAAEEAIRDPAILGRAIKTLEVDTLLCVPSLYQRLLAAPTISIGDGTLSRVIVAGEVCPPALIAESARRAPKITVFNEYGPTEGTVWATVYECREQTSGPIPIGRPIRGTDIHILDATGEPVAPGASGEICIGGAGVAQGYLNLPELTAHRFVPNRFDQNTHARLYRTGDLGRWRPDGNLEYLGRNDDQVKLRGYRIELGEVESALLRHPRVQQATALVREDRPGDQLLAAYVVMRGESAVSLETGRTDPAPNQPIAAVEELQTFLRGELPGYMLPSSIAILADLPRTPNGKVDRGALPRPVSGVGRAMYEAPQGAVEETLAEIWQQLLGIDRIGRHDHFLELGGHSLRMMQLVEQLHQRGWVGAIENAFAHPRLSDFARTVKALSHEPPGDGMGGIPTDWTAIIPSMVPLVHLTPAELDRLAAKIPGGAANIQDILPLTPLQQGMLFHHLDKDAAGDTYVLPTLLEFESQKVLTAFTEALNELIKRHDALRTSIAWEGLTDPVQILQRTANLRVVENILTDSAPVAQQLRSRLWPDAPILDLTHAPLMRLEVYSAPADARVYGILRLHHMIVDHESIEMLFWEARACMERKQTLLPPIAPYRDYIRKVLNGPQREAVQSFFGSKLGDVEEPTASYGLTDVRGDGKRKEEARKSLSPEMTARVRAEARRLAVTPAALFHSAWALVVAATSAREQDVVFGSLFGGRLLASGSEQHTLGLFINTLPVRIRVAERNPRQFVEAVQKELTELLPYQQSSLAAAQRCAAIPGTQPLFNTLLNCLYSGPDGTSVGSAPAPGMRVLDSREWTNYPITLSVDAVGEGYYLIAQTDDRVSPDRILGYMQSALDELLTALADDVDRSVLSLPIVPAIERRMMFEEFNRTEAEWPQDQLIHELFERQVTRAPEATALLWAENRMTYAELNGRATHFAGQLQAHGVEPGEFVPVLMERGVDLLVAQLAILKVGAAYVPIDPELPAERQNFMVRDCRARRLIHVQDSPLVAAVCNSIQTIPFQLDTETPRRPLNEPIRLNARRAPAYLMYTSGSTGEPKGVVVSHQGVVKLCINNGYAQIGPGDCVVHGANPAFDASTFEIWAALLNGARVLVVPQSVLFDASRLANELKRHQVTVLWMTIGLLMQYAEALGDVFGQLRYLITGGDVVGPELVKRVMRLKSPACFLNAYGPTECTTFATMYRIAPQDAQAASLPIGRPISNTRIYVLNNHLQPVPLGAVGEIYIGGLGVALGYLDRPQAAAARFIRDPFSADPEDRLYRTGDLGRWKADGNLEFAGRSDQQVKVRGYRVELGEIETHLLQYPGIQQAVVVARETGTADKHLVAYITKEGDETVDSGHCRKFLQGRLPQYMVPNAIVVLDRLPLSANGKVDRRALPTPELDAFSIRDYVPPEGELEVRLARVWQERLRVPRVGRYDNFFELGGHSLLAMQVVVHIRATLSIEMPMTALFEFPTLELLATEVQRLRQAQLSAAIRQGGTEIEELLSLVESMPESTVRQWVQELTSGGMP